MRIVGLCMGKKWMNMHNRILINFRERHFHFKNNLLYKTKDIWHLLGSLKTLSNSKITIII